MTTQTKIDEFFNRSHAVQVEGGTWYYHSEPVQIVEDLQKRIAELESLLKKFLPMDEDGNGWDFQYNEGSEYLGVEVVTALGLQERKEND